MVRRNPDPLLIRIHIIRLSRQGWDAALIARELNNTYGTRLDAAQVEQELNR